MDIDSVENRLFAPGLGQDDVSRLASRLIRRSARLALEPDRPVERAAQGAASDLEAHLTDLVAAAHRRRRACVGTGTASSGSVHAALPPPLRGERVSREDAGKRDPSVEHARSTARAAHVAASPQPTAD